MSMFGYHFTQKLDVQLPCQYCQLLSKRQLSEYKCDQCSIEYQRDVSLCALCFFPYHSLKFRLFREVQPKLRTTRLRPPGRKKGTRRGQHNLKVFKKIKKQVSSDQKK